MKHSFSLAGVILLASFISPAQAWAPQSTKMPEPVVMERADNVLLAWSTGQDQGGWYIRNSDAKIYFDSERKAKRTARQFNRIEKRAEKKADSVKAEDDGPCGPLGDIQDGPVDLC